ncbi:MAG: outer membrane protein assembly factor BamA [Candidatus Omnitrophica bacterium]|nr:outer membrane protein assembly factor BamA [Candidatus Omnitrophota bacterium]MBU1809479.1 outer membrane protein assembly factor BamA [Candidatus Omnitrophota bacterium]
MKLIRLALALGIFAILLPIISGSAVAQSAEGKTITGVKVENNKAISSEIILSKIKTASGEVFNQEIINEDLKRLYATDYFTDVSVDVREEAAGVIVIFLVEEKLVVEDIDFKGNVAFRSPKLKSMLKSKPNEMMNLAVLAQDVAEIRNFYSKKGYPFTEVRYEISVDKDTGKASVTIVIDEKTRVKVAGIDIVGNKAIKTNEIKKILSTKPAWLFNPGIFKDEVLQEDMDRIRLIYDDIGYLDAETTPDLQYGPDGQTLKIVINIKENKQYMVGDIIVKGNLVLPEKEILSKITMKSGKPFSNRGLRQDSSEIKQLYYERGYMNAIQDVERNFNQSTGNIDVVFNIDGKDPVYVGMVEIRGNMKTRELVVRRELRIYPGEKFNGDKIKRSKERLYNLGYFENVAFDTEPTETPDIQNLIVTVKETKTGEFSFGGGYSSVDMLVGFVEITQRNFDIMSFPTFTGGGQNLTIKAELGMVRSDFNISWTDPWIFGMPYAFGFDAYRAAHARRNDIGWAYDETRTGGDLRLGKDFTDQIRGLLTYRLENVKISNLADDAAPELSKEVGANYISSLTFDVSYDTRDNVYVASKGFIVNGSIENAGGIFLGNKDYVKGTGMIAYYHSFFKKIVLELKARGGMVGAYGKSDEVPIYERFFAGGANTIRGYKERRIGPRAGDQSIGGDSIVVVNAEATFPVYEKIIKGAVFYDLGNVWAKSSDFLVGGDYKSGAGIGIRVKTPIGPVKLDYGFPLVQNYDDEKGGEFYFSMSRGF